ncbi:uncharacterized protein BCR38DRAFT_67666 [Pseudomassariella vexata]|uniref:BTB domain-containing protein n=1 Tax=Pseudomassariella vexata TaxID=1141098 RepID=A0A1Y2DJ59_9PEZI|nr:uncharacterized protein BCR38DRAFT_67666 [Pseudomassariella vexata]ORY59288.1 hypothetical protein BCR38DRAFT_67666 [Pseudomassariella vexata]
MAGWTTTTELTDLFALCATDPTPCPFTGPHTPQPASRKIVLDPDGDLLLQVGESGCASATGEHDLVTPVVFVSCSKSLSRASAVWKRLLYGGFAESRGAGSGNWEVQLPDDNIKAMTMVLAIIHGRFELLPPVDGSIGLEDLYQLTVLTDKYDLTRLLRPWARSWLQNSQKNKTATLGATPSERRIWIAWELGDRQLFQAALEDLVLNSSAHARDQHLSSIGRNELFSNSLEPLGVQDHIKSNRLNAITTLLDLYQTALTKLLAKTPATREPYGYHPIVPAKACVAKIDPWRQYEQRQCDLIMLGSLIESLSWSGLWPLPAASCFQESLLDLASKLKSLKCESFREVGDGGSRHSNCHPMPDGAQQIDAILASIRTQPTDDQLRHLETQAKKSGLRV